MHAKKRIATLVCLSGVMTSGAVLAQDPALDKGFYLGFSAGRTRATFDTSPAILGGLPLLMTKHPVLGKAIRAISSTSILPLKSITCGSVITTSMCQRLLDLNLPISR